MQKIKNDLIHKAKVKQSYAKIKEREAANLAARSSYYKDAEGDDNENGKEVLEEPTANLELHPTRQAMLLEPEGREHHASSEGKPRQRSKRRKSQPFAKEAKLAEERKEEARKRQELHEENNRTRQQRIEGRERHRRALAKARQVGKNGQRKLGRESKILLEKVQQLVAES